MAKQRAVRRSRRTVPRRGRKPAAPKPFSHKNGSYLFNADVASYAIPVFSVDAFKRHPDQVGEFDTGSQEIYVREDLGCPAREADVLLHELLHAVSFVVLTTKDRLTERQVNAMSVALVDTLRKNPKLAAYLTDRLA